MLDLNEKGLRMTDDKNLDPAKSPSALDDDSVDLKDKIKGAPKKIMDAAHSPENWSKQLGEQWGGKRINKIPAMMGLMVLLGFVLVVALVGSRKGIQYREEDEEKNVFVQPTEIAGMNNTGLIDGIDLDKPPLPMDVPQKNVQPAKAPQLALPSPAPSANLGAPLDEDMIRLKQQRQANLQEAARAKSSVAFNNRNNGRSGGLQGANDNSARSRLAAVRQAIEQTRNQNPTASFQNRLAQMRSNDNNLMTASASANFTQPSSDLFMVRDSNGGDRWELNSNMQAPRTPFELRAGFVIPAVLIGGINSELPGQIIGQVSQNVFDTATGNNLLIPQGSRLVGQYSSSVAYGQSRVLVSWERIVFPDGKAFDLGSMQGADEGGMSGFKDKVDNHYFRIFGQAILMSLITAGVSYTQNNYNYSDSQRASDALSEALGQQLGTTMTNLVNKNLNISPTLEIRSGFRFNVVVTKDLTFAKAYESFDY